MFNQRNVYDDWRSGDVTILIVSDPLLFSVTTLPVNAELLDFLRSPPVSVLGMESTGEVNGAGVLGSGGPSI